MANIGGHRPKRPKTFHHMTIEAGENGGHVMTHHFDGYENQPEVHAFGPKQGRDAAAHVIKHMGMDVSKQLSDGENHEDSARELEAKGDE